MARLGKPEDPGAATQQPEGAGPDSELETVPLTPEERIERLERRLATRTYAAAALLVMTLAAAIVAIVLAVDARESSATASDLTRLEQRVATVAEQAGVGETAQEEVDSLDSRVDSLEDELGGISSDAGATTDQLSVIEDDIEDLRQQISDVEAGATESDGGAEGSGGVSPDDDDAGDQGSGGSAP